MNWVGVPMRFFLENSLRKAFSAANAWYSIGVSIIILTHVLLSLFGFSTFHMPLYMQVVQNQFPITKPFWPMLFYFHGNPPLLSIIHHVAQVCFPENPSRFFELILPIFHSLSFLAFSQAIRRFSIPIRPVWLLIIFLNPLIFIYFRYPFYSSFLFFLNSILLFQFSRLKEKTSAIYWIACIFSLEALLRSTCQPLLFLPILVWLVPVRKLKTIALLFLIMLPPILWQAKNYWLIEKFTSSSWLGMNLARSHMPWQVHNDLVAFLPPLSDPNQYMELLKDEPTIKEAMKDTNYYLSQNNLNHRVIPVVSDLYLKSIRKEFSFSWSLNTVINGYLIFFQSPVNEANVRRHLVDEGYFSKNGINPDFWEPIGFQDENYWYKFFVSTKWDKNWNRLHAAKRITIYTLVYPFLLIWFGFKFRSLSKDVKLIYLLTGFFTVVYISIDIFEANRMRMEIEVFYYFLLLLFLQQTVLIAIRKALNQMPRQPSFLKKSLT